MSDMRLTDTQFSAGLKGIVPSQAQAGLRAQILAEVGTTAQERPLPGLLGRLTDADPNARRRAVLLAAAALLALGFATAGVAGALLQEREDPFDDLDLAPPKDLLAFVRSTYENMPQLPPLTLTALQDGTTKRRIYVDGSGAIRIEKFASLEATEPGRYDVFSGTSIASVVTVGSERRWLPPSNGAIADDPRVFVYAAMWGTWPSATAGCELATGPGEEYVGEPGRDWTYVGAETIAGRPAHHVSCGGHDVWIDSDTRLMLRDRSAGGTTEVTEIAFGQPAADLFDIRQPEGIAAISEEEFNEYECARDPVCSATPRPVATLLPAQLGLEPPGDLGALVATAVAADDALPAFEVMIERTYTALPDIDRTFVRYDGSERYRHEFTNEDPANPPSIWLVGRDYSYRSQWTTDRLGEYWLAEGPESEDSGGRSYPLELPEVCLGSWQFLGVDQILGRSADHIGCPNARHRRFEGPIEFWIDRETHLVMRVLMVDDPDHGSVVEEVVELRLVAQEPELFELPVGAELRDKNTLPPSAQPSTAP
jgi:hypothetical protein